MTSKYTNTGISTQHAFDKSLISIKPFELISNIRCCCHLVNWLICCVALICNVVLQFHISLVLLGFLRIQPQPKFNLKFPFSLPISTKHQFVVEFHSLSASIKMCKEYIYFCVLSMLMAHKTMHMAHACGTAIQEKYKCQPTTTE